MYKTTHLFSLILLSSLQLTQPNHMHSADEGTQWLDLRLCWHSSWQRQKNQRQALLSTSGSTQRGSLNRNPTNKQSTTHYDDHSGLDFQRRLQSVVDSITLESVLLTTLKKRYRSIDAVSLFGLHWILEQLMFSHIDLAIEVKLPVVIVDVSATEKVL